LTLADARSRAIDVDDRGGTLDLLATVRVTDAHLWLVLEYDPAAVDRSSVEAVAARFKRQIDQVFDV